MSTKSKDASSFETIFIEASVEAPYWSFLFDASIEMICDIYIVLDKTLHSMKIQYEPLLKDVH